MNKFSKVKKILNKHWWILILLFLIPSFSRLIHKGFFPTQDYIYVARIYEMNKSFKDGQFPVRWVPDFRYGEPLFNYYAPLPYYLGSIVHSFNISFLDTSKILYALGLILSFFSMYLLGKEFWGKIGGLISAFIYLYAPYRAVDVFVRGDISESWVFVFFPLIFWAALRLSKRVDTKNIILLSLSLAGLFYTHNVMTMLFAPFFILWMIYLVWNEKRFKLIYPLILSSLLGVALAASFLLPAFLERSYIQTQHLTDGYFDFRAHFVVIRQFFSTFWGYGASVWGPGDGMSFQVGVVQWIAIGLTIILGFIKRKELFKDRTIYLLGVVFASFLFSLFMQHNKSTFIWLAIPILQYVQFPWRFLAITVFFAAIFVGSLAKLLPKYKYLVLSLVIVGSVTLTYNYFRPDFYYDNATDDGYISQQTLSIEDKLPKDYLPIWVKKISSSKITRPIVVSGQAEISDYVARSDSATFDLSVKKDAVIDVPLTFFPGWEVKLNKSKITLMDPSDLGLIRFVAPEGSYKVQANFDNTPIRTIGNTISVMAIGVILYLIFFSKKRLVKQKSNQK
jgi:hypothetical protein